MSAEPDLLERLSRLAPDVDAERALAAFQAERPRRRPTGRILLAAVVIAVVAALVVIAQRRGDDTIVAAEGDDAVTATATDGQVELTLTVEHGSVVAGERLWADVTIRNLGDTEIAWSAGGCSLPATVVLTPAGPAPQAPEGPAAPWDGDLAGLAAWLGQHNTVASSFEFAEEEFIGVNRVCILEIRLEPIAPGDEVHMRVAVDVALPPGPVPSGGAYRVLAAFGAFSSTDLTDLSVNDPSLTTVQARVEVRDDSRREGSDAALVAIAADPRLQAWLDGTAEMILLPGTIQSYMASFAWIRGAWELRITAGDTSTCLASYQIRFDPTRETVVDEPLSSCL